MEGWIPKKDILAEQIQDEIYKLRAKRVPQYRPTPLTTMTEEPLIMPDWTQPTPAIQNNMPTWAQAPTTYRDYEPTLPQPIEEPVAKKELPPMPEVTQPKEVAWYDQPKALTERVMSGVGKAISIIPGAETALKFISPAFEFIHENLEDPWAATITAPFSTTLPWREGESWIEHEKREYASWEAPSYVKGAAEFAMPLWWVPWVGWAGKGARALGIGGKLIKAGEVGTKTGKFMLPSKEMLNATYKIDPFRKFSWWAENKPILNRVVKSLGGESAFVKSESTTPIDIARREIVNRAMLRDMRHGAKGILLPRLQKFGDPIKLLGIDEQGIVQGVTPKGSIGRGLGRGLSEVIEHPQAYEFATTEARQFVFETRKIIVEVMGLAEKEGVKIPKGFIYHRIVKGKTLTSELAKKLGTDIEKSEYGSLFELQRHHPTMEGGIKAGVQYGNNPLESIASTIDHYIRKIADKRFTDEVGKLGAKPMDKFATQFPEEATKISSLIEAQISGKYARSVLQTMLSYKGVNIPTNAVKKIKRGIPDLAERLDDMLSIAPAETDAMITAMGKETLKAAKINPTEFKETLAYFVKGDKIKLGDISDTIRQWNIPETVAQKAITKIYKQAYKLNKQTFDDVVNTMKGEVDDIVTRSTSELRPLKAHRAGFLKKYVGLQALGTGEARFRSHPVFKNTFFPKEVVELTEKVLGEKGQNWVRDLGMVSGVSRMLTAALDFSAPFIQGLSVLGHNPVAWTKAVGKQFEFFIDPRNMYKYMTTPEAMTIRTQRALYGGSTSTFEFFEALSPLQKMIEKIPSVGKFGKKLIGQTYGRAEAAFTGFGEVARNEMWKALRRPNMANDQLRELARTVDRMTGVMSTEALGIGISQRDVESAFMFFAPRYTRASLAFVGDLFRGGMTGAEARKSVAALTAGGMSFYAGTCAVLGQTPEFDPRSAKFMTVEIDNQRVGIGGILYGLMRLGAGVVGTAATNPTDLFQPFKGGVLNRFDNPFLKFMYQRTAPLTSMGISAVVEQKNYFGEPFESPADWARFMAEKVTPIAMQSVMPWEKQKGTLPVFLSEISGGRTFPKSAWEFREEARDRIAQERFGQTYATLNKLQQKEIDSEPEIESLQEEADVRTAQIGGVSYDFLRWRQERDDARLTYEQDLWQAQKAVDVGLLTPLDFRQRLQDAGTGLGKTYEHINRNPAYKEVMAKLEEPKDVSKEYIGDLVYDYLNEARISFEDEYGIFDYDAYDEFKEKLRQTYGDEVIQYTESRIEQSHKTLPPLAQEYYKAQKVLKPYWAVKGEVEKILGKPKSKYQQAKFDRIVGRIHKQKKTSNQEMAKYYNMFYARVS